MKHSTILVAGVVAVAAVTGAGVAITAAASSDDNEEPITGDALEQATAAALEHTGGGSVTETEVGDEDSYYEVEVTLEDGTQLDVQLDEQFQVVSSDPDSEDDPDDND